MPICAKTWVLARVLHALRIVVTKMKMKLPAIHSKGSKKVYIVLGNARSGTTFLARAIKMALESMGRPWRFDEEVHDSISSINNIILSEAGGDMWHPPSVERIIEAGEYCSDMMENYLGGIAGANHFWGFKDPRTSLTLPAWLPLFEDNEDVYLIAIFRKPNRVADSLDNLGWGLGNIEENKKVIRQYNNRILDNVRRFLDEE